MNEQLPPDEEKARNVRKLSRKYTLVVCKLYKMGRATLMFKCLTENETNLLLMKVHEGVCGSHIG